MVGIFDSGVGGYNSLYEIRRQTDRLDVIYLADYKNAPYGVKTERELIPIVEENIKALLSRGCEWVLIACCTASAMYKYLPSDLRERSLPIIPPTVEAVRREGAGRVTLIATERTVKSGAFSEISHFAELCEIAAQPLVEVVERGDWKSPYIDSLIERIKESEPSVLVLGCTHFSALYRRFCEELTGVKIISPAQIGAKEILKRVKNLGTSRVEYI